MEAGLSDQSPSILRRIWQFPLVAMLVALVLVPFFLFEHQFNARPSRPWHAAQSVW